MTSILEDLRTVIRNEEAIEADVDPDISGAACLHLPILQRAAEEIERMQTKTVEIADLVQKYFILVCKANDTTAAEILHLRTALEQIERWDGFPETEDGRSYAYHWGSNGERDFMRGEASRALKEGK